MLFFKQTNCLHLTKFIAACDFALFIACNHCYSASSLCIVMTDYAKCFKCTHHDHSCVLVSLKSLNHAYLQLKSELKVTMNDCVKQAVCLSEQTECLSELNVKVLHLFKTLEQNESHAIVKIHCVISELSDNNNGMKNKKNLLNSLNLNFLLKSMSFSFFTDSGPLS